MTIVQPRIETFTPPKKAWWHRPSTWGRLLDDYTYYTPIKGFDKKLEIANFRCRLFEDGRLTIFAGSEWDFGSFAIDTPAMVFASLAHDAFCHLTNYSVLPWEIRFQADKYFWHCLTVAGATISRLWRVPGVMIYSQCIAQWKDIK